MTNTAPQAVSPPVKSAARRFFARLAFISLLWLGLNGTDWASWLMGAPVVLAAAVVSQRMCPARPWRWSARGAAIFAGFFLRESVRGGWDVAWRAMSPRVCLSPAILPFSPRLPAGTARLFFCNTISLLPGTAVVAIEDDRIHIHLLDETTTREEDLRVLEERVAGLFGLTLPRHEKEVA